MRLPPRRRHRLAARGVVLALGAVVAGLTGCVPGEAEPGVVTRTDSSSSSSPTTAPRPREVRAYLLRGEQVAPVARSADDEGSAARALEGLLAGPTPVERDAGLVTAIPADTGLLGVSLDGRVATVDLSGAFGSGGGSTSMQARVAQVVFTATQFPTVDAVSFELDGRPLKVLGGEGLVLDRPQRRADWEAFAPAILVESPLPGAEVGNPVRVTGSANTFEATFWLKVTDAAGRVVYERHATATSGSGTRGTFDVTAPLDSPRPGPGTVTVYESSAQDGRPIHVVEVPVRIAGP